MGRIQLFINEFFLNESNDVSAVYKYLNKFNEPIAIISKELFSINIYSLKMILEIQDLKEICKYFKIKESKKFTFKKIYQKYNYHQTIHLKIDSKLALRDISLPKTSPITSRNQISSVEYTIIDVNNELEINKTPIEYVRYLNNYFIIHELFKIIHIDEIIGMEIINDYELLKKFFYEFDSKDNLINSNMKKYVLDNSELVCIKNIYKSFPKEFEFGKSLAKMVLNLVECKFKNYNNLYEMKNNSSIIVDKIVN